MKDFFSYIKSKYINCSLSDVDPYPLTWGWLGCSGFLMMLWPAESALSGQLASAVFPALIVYFLYEAIAHILLQERSLRTLYLNIAKATYGFGVLHLLIAQYGATFLTWLRANPESAIAIAMASAALAAITGAVIAADAVTRTIYKTFHLVQKAKRHLASGE